MFGEVAQSLDIRASLVLSPTSSQTSPGQGRLAISVFPSAQLWMRGSCHVFTNSVTLWQALGAPEIPQGASLHSVCTAGLLRDSMSSCMLIKTTRSKNVNSGYNPGDV